MKTMMLQEKEREGKRGYRGGNRRRGITMEDEKKKNKTTVRKQ